MIYNNVATVLSSKLIIPGLIMCYCYLLLLGALNFLIDGLIPLNLWLELIISTTSHGQNRAQTGLSVIILQGKHPSLLMGFFRYCLYLSFLQIFPVIWIRSIDTKSDEF